MHSHLGHTQVVAIIWNVFANHFHHISFFSDVIGLSGIFFVYGVIGIVAVVFIYLVLPETKGKSLHKIDRELSQTRYENIFAVVTRKACFSFGVKPFGQNEPEWYSNGL